MKHTNHTRAVGAPIALSRLDLASIEGGATQQSPDGSQTGNGQQTGSGQGPQEKPTTQPNGQPPQLPTGTNVIQRQWSEFFGEDAIAPSSRRKSTLAGMLDM
jgi:hypothetical protein